MSHWKIYQRRRDSRTSSRRRHAVRATFDTVDSIDLSMLLIDRYRQQTCGCCRDRRTPSQRRRVIRATFDTINSTDLSIVSIDR